MSIFLSLSVDLPPNHLFSLSTFLHLLLMQHSSSSLKLSHCLLCSFSSSHRCTAICHPENLQDLFFFFVVIYHVTSAHPWSKCSVILLCSFLTSPRLDCWYFFRPPLSSQGIIKINQEACSFITGHNAHGVFGTHWLAIGSTCPFVRRPGTFRALQCSTSICPQLGATLGRY